MDFPTGVFPTGESPQGNSLWGFPCRVLPYKRSPDRVCSFWGFPYRGSPYRKSRFGGFPLWGFPRRWTSQPAGRPAQQPGPGPGPPPRSPGPGGDATPPRIMNDFGIPINFMNAMIIPIKYLKYRQESHFHSYTRPGWPHAANINIPIGIPMIFRCLGRPKARGGMKMLYFQ